MQSNKPKILFLATSDINVDGHCYSEYLKCPDFFEKKIVVENSVNGDTGISFHVLNWKGIALKARLLYKISQLRFALYCLFHYGCFTVTNKQCIDYDFFWREWTPYSADDILRKAGDFKPDIISIYWSSRFLTSNVIRELHEKTGALINFVFVDQAPMTGGCHYPMDCKGYLNKCENCPALSIGKSIAYYQFERKKNNYKDLPVCLTATSSDLKLAKKSVLFSGVKYYIHSIAIPQIMRYEKNSCREKYHFKVDDYVVVVGASGLQRKRKGIEYAIDAVKIAANKIPNIQLVCIGNGEVEGEFPSNVNVVQLGFLSRENYYEVLTAADCFLSTTIADSGPMMVNHSIVIGTPVVSFYIGIAQTLVKHKETGYIADYKNSLSVAEGILYIYTTLLSQKDYFSINCKKLIKDISSQKNVFERLYDVYQNYRPSRKIIDASENVY